MEQTEISPNVDRDTAICARTARGLHPVCYIFIRFLYPQCLRQRETGRDEGQDAGKQACERQVCLVLLRAFITLRSFVGNSLRRRFQSTHDDVCFTIMALMPTLASQILEDMDVETLTNELQSISRASRSRAHISTHKPQLSQSVSELSAASDVNSDAGSASFSSAGSTFDGDRVSLASGSWIIHPSSSGGPSLPLDASAQLSDSVTSANSSPSQNGRNIEDPVTSPSPRTRAQLWNEVKMLGAVYSLAICA